MAAAADAGERPWPEADEAPEVSASSSSSSPSEEEEEDAEADRRLSQEWERQKSNWRWPSMPGKLPRYVRADFRAKAFALIWMQLLVVFVVTAIVDLALTTARQRAEVTIGQFVALEGGALVLLFAAYFVRTRYPLNYALLAILTLFVGFSWGFGGNIVATHAHFQLLGILGIAVGVALAAQVLAQRQGLRQCRGDPVLRRLDLRLHCHGSGSRIFGSVAAPLFAGWAFGSVAMVLATVCLGDNLKWTLLAVAVSFCQIACLLLDAQKKLRRCNPDDFVRIVISMDSTLLVVVSTPLFVLLAVIARAGCAVHCAGEDEEAPGERAAEQAAPVPRNA